MILRFVVLVSFSFVNIFLWSFLYAHKLILLLILCIDLNHFILAYNH